MESITQKNITKTIQYVQIHPNDNVCVAVHDVASGIVLDNGITTAHDVPAGHKIALRCIAQGEKILKYGFPIGSATEDIPEGAWIHSHNLSTDLCDEQTLSYSPETSNEKLKTTNHQPKTFLGYRRKNGLVATRNEIWVVNTVGCVNGSAERIAKIANERFAAQGGEAESRIDGVHSFSHPFGCSQLGDDLVNTRRILAGLIRNPNAGGILVLGLGCENNQMKALLELVGDSIDRERLRFFNTQEVEDEIESGLQAVLEILEVMKSDKREAVPLSELRIGVKCGGSDGFSGITANALVGRITDVLVELGATVLQTEVPEMFGAEEVLARRCKDEATFTQFAEMIDNFKQYFVKHNQPVYENPSPGNKSGGLTTLEEKSLGAIQKGGTATVSQILSYGEAARNEAGLALVNAPGNDGVSSTAMTASGATMLLFTTGRGTPLGFPVPTVKISSNSDIATKKPHWIDFNAGKALEGASLDDLRDSLLERIIAIASGTERTNNERNGYREIAIWKAGVTL
jgi:altronate hydrolase